MFRWTIALALTLIGCSQPKLDPQKAWWAAQSGQVHFKSQRPLQIALATFDSAGNCTLAQLQTLQPDQPLIQAIPDQGRLYVCLIHPPSDSLKEPIAKAQKGEPATLLGYLDEWKHQGQRAGQAGGALVVEVGAHRHTSADAGNPALQMKSRQSVAPSAGAGPVSIDSEPSPVKAELEWKALTVEADQPQVLLYVPRAL